MFRYCQELHTVHTKQSILLRVGRRNQTKTIGTICKLRFFLNLWVSQRTAAEPNGCDVGLQYVNSDETAKAYWTRIYLVEGFCNFFVFFFFSKRRICFKENVSDISYDADHRWDLQSCQNNAFLILGKNMPKSNTLRFRLNFEQPRSTFVIRAKWREACSILWLIIETRILAVFHGGLFEIVLKYRKISPQGIFIF